MGAPSAAEWNAPPATTAALVHYDSHAMLAARPKAPARRLLRVGLAAAVGAACLLVGCDRGADDPPPAPPAPSPGVPEPGDLDEIRERGELVILTTRLEDRGLSRRGSFLDADLELARAFAETMGVTPRLRVVEAHADIVPALADGAGDLAVARLTITPAREALVAFTRPIDRVREMLVQRTSDAPARSLEELSGLTVAARPSSAYRDTLDEIRRAVPGITLIDVAEDVTTVDVLLRLAEGAWDAAVADEDIVAFTRGFEPRIAPTLPLATDRPIGWAVRDDAPRLLETVDRYLLQEVMTQDLRDVAPRTLEEIRESGVLRVLTRNNAATYFLYRGHRMGFEFELARRFAKRLDCRLQVIVPPDASLLAPWLLEGRGDLVAASWTITDERARQVAFGPPYLEVTEMVVVRAEEADEVFDIGDLDGKTIAMRPSSSYARTLASLQPAHGFELVEVDDDVETEALIADVAAGIYDATVADSHILSIETAWRDDVAAAFPLGPPRRLAWAVRPESEAMLAELDAFFDDEIGGTFFNVLKGKYFENERRVGRRAERRRGAGGRLSAFDELFREAAERHDLDWRLLAAVAHQESRFDPKRTSWAGASGLMQLMPRTARDIGISGDLHDPAVGIEAGARYLRWLTDLFEDDLPEAVRLRFALASYNVGRGHILDARDVARRRGWDGDRWFGEVERAIPLLSRREVAAQTRHGYCRCTEPVKYVREVSERFREYVEAGY